MPKKFKFCAVEVENQMLTEFYGGDQKVLFFLYIYFCTVQ